MGNSENFGKYQKINIALLFFPIWYSAFPLYAFIFATGDVKYRCLVPECEEKESSVYSTTWINNAIPMKNSFTLEKCQRFIPKNINHSQYCSEFDFTNMTQICNDWVFKNEEITIVQDFNLTCEANKWKLSSVGTFGNVGTFFGLLFNGLMSDRFGRKRMMIIVGFLSSCAGLLQSWSSNYITYVIFEMVVTFICDVFTLSFLLGLELVKPQKRVLATTILNCYFTFGEMWISFAMWLTRDWRKMLRFIYFPGLFIILYHWLIPESMRWLTTQKKTKERNKILYKMSKMNGTDLNDLTDSPLKMEKTNTENENNKAKGFIVSKILIFRVMLCSCCWIANTFVYFGLAINSVSLAGNKYLNFFFVSLVTIPAYIFMIFMQNVRRKIFLSSTLCLAAVACTLFHFIPSEAAWLKLLAFLLGKFSITLSFSFVYLYTAELFPTEMRHTFVSVCSMIARIGSGLAPLTPMLEPFIDPVLILGLVSLIAAFVALTLPETLNKPLPDTVKEAEDLGKN